MPRNQSILLRLTVEEKDYIDEVCVEANISRPNLLMEAVYTFVEDHPKKYKQLISRGKTVKKVIDAKEYERKTGDYVGSFKKLEKKIERIREGYSNDSYGEKMRDDLIEDARENYGITQKAYEKELRRKRRKLRRKKK